MEYKWNCFKGWRVINRAGRVSKKTQSYIEEEKKKLFSFFKNEYFAYSNSAANYYLLKDQRLTDQKEFLTFLLNNGIIARHTYNYPSLEGSWLRFAIKSIEQNQRLREC
ncbi:hypothetical protein AAHH67_29800 [Niallia circulans]